MCVPSRMHHNDDCLKLLQPLYGIDSENKVMKILANPILIEKDRQNEIFSIDIDQFDPITTKNTTSKSALQAYGNSIIEKIRRGYLVLCKSSLESSHFFK